MGSMTVITFELPADDAERATLLDTVRAAGFDFTDDQVTIAMHQVEGLPDHVPALTYMVHDLTVDSRIAERLNGAAALLSAGVGRPGEGMAGIDLRPIAKRYREIADGLDLFAHAKFEHARGTYRARRALYTTTAEAEPPLVSQLHCDRCDWSGTEADLVGDIGNCPKCGSTWEVTEVSSE